MVDVEKEDLINNSLIPSNEEVSNDVILIKEGNDLTDKIVDETDPTKLEDLTKLFTLNQKKKDISRANRLSNLLSVIDDEVIMRFTSTPEAFDNDQLLNYMKSTQQAITNVSQSINQVPQIQINTQNNEIHINNSGLNQESRAKVLDAVSKILKSLDNKTEIIDLTVEENEEEE